MAGDDAMDVEAVRAGLAAALRLQLGSLSCMTILAGALRGVHAIGIKPMLRGYLQAEVSDTYLLAEKLTALGGQPPTRVPDLAEVTNADTAIGAFIDAEADVVAALHAVIPFSGQQPHSEALEHLLEHIIVRKQEQIDFLRLALDSG